jgi:sigma-E factor negative regulatory protein RseA
MNKSNHDELISSMLDSELSDAQLDVLLDCLKGQDGKHVMQTWARYHELGDVLRSDDLAITFTEDFSARMFARLDAEPVVLAPQKITRASNKKGVNKSAYWAITSVAATVMLAFLMAPQIVPLLNSPSVLDGGSASVELADPFASPGLKLASNSAATHPSKDADFAPKLENQVEMLRDPRLDSYLLALPPLPLTNFHQDVFP